MPRRALQSGPNVVHGDCGVARWFTAQPLAARAPAAQTLAQALAQALADRPRACRRRRGRADAAAVAAAATETVTETTPSSTAQPTNQVRSRTTSLSDPPPDCMQKRWHTERAHQFANFECNYCMQNPSDR